MNYTNSAMPIVEFRRQFPGHFLLIQKGSFYEIMGPDVQLIENSTVPLRVGKTGMAGFPVEATDSWLPLLEQEFGRIALFHEVSHHGRGSLR